MSGSGTIPNPLRCPELKKLLMYALEDAPETRNPETFHARFDHLERGLQMDDVVFGIETEWKACRPLGFNKRHWQWKYEISTESADEVPLTIIVAVDTANRSFEVITRWTEDTTV
jgi:hypothetical protein